MKNILLMILGLFFVDATICLYELKSQSFDKYEKMILRYDSIMQQQRDTLLSWNTWYLVWNDKLNNNCHFKHHTYGSIEIENLYPRKENQGADNHTCCEKYCASVRIFLLYNIDRIFHQLPTINSMCDTNLLLVYADSVPVFDYRLDNSKTINKNTLPKNMLDSCDTLTFTEWNSRYGYRNTRTLYRLNVHDYEKKNLYLKFTHGDERAEIVFSHYRNWIAQMRVFGLGYLIKNKIRPLPHDVKWLNFEEYENSYRFTRSPSK
ncbi:MAG: hypothetical protein ACK6DA_04500 [Candidatus Kapaibacterium sp.]